MSKEVLEKINASMEALGLDYEYMAWKSEPVYPYWVGEYQEIEPYSEDGLFETSFTLTGFTRGAYADLESQKNKVMEHFDPVIGKRVMVGNSAVAIFYAGAIGNLQTGDAELKKIQVNLIVKEWRVM